jgi:serralysin
MSAGISAAVEIPELLTGYKWEGRSITFSFMEGVPHYSDIPQSSFASLSISQQRIIRTILAELENYINVKFVEVAHDLNANRIGDIAIGMRSMLDPATTDANLKVPGSGGDIYFDKRTFNNATGDFFRHTALHEILHALGLGHPSGSLPPYYNYTAEAYHGGGLQARPFTPQLYDISALQYLYGAAEKNAGDTVYDFTSKDQIFSIWDTGGNDTFSAAAATSGVRINLNDTAFSSVGFGHSPDDPANNISIARNDRERPRKRRGRHPDRKRAGQSAQGR